MDVGIDAIVARLHDLEEENTRLKSFLARHGIRYEAEKKGNNISGPIKRDALTSRLSLQEKVELFQSLFKGREDVFAMRWYSDTAKKSGCQPVCEREWDRGFCDKRKYKCAECPNRQFATLS